MRAFHRPSRLRAGPADPRHSFLPAAILAALICAPALTTAAGPAVQRFSVQGLDGRFIPIGEVEFCRNGERDCLYADLDRGFPGHFSLPVSDLVPGVKYTVMIYTADVQVIYVLRDWVYVPQDYDTGWDKVLGCAKFLVFAQFHGDAQGGLTFRVDTTLNPVWEERAGSSFTVTPSDPAQYPDFLLTAHATAMVGGRFSSDSSAAGGVISAAPGPALAAIWRHGYRTGPDRSDDWITCREFSLGYAQNRYETAEIMTPGRLSDVTFHRLNAAYGLARMSPAQITHYGIAAVLSFGGIYDGSRRLAFLGRTYGLAGVGVQAHYRRIFLSGGGLKAGLSVEGAAIWYPADADDDDFWFGLAPSLSLGVVVF